MTESIFIRYGKTIIPSSKKMPTQDHPQLSQLIDILSRKEHHHLILITDFSEKIRHAFLEGMSNHLAEPLAPFSLRKTHFIYFDMQKFLLADERAEDITQDFNKLLTTLDSAIRAARDDKGMLDADSRILFAINHLDWLSHEHYLASTYLSRLLKTVWMNDAWRFILLVKKEEYQRFISKYTLPAGLNIFTLQDVNEEQALQILTLFRPELETYHQVIFPDETLLYAYDLARRYLSHSEALDKTLLLLDSAAARSSKIDQEKSIVTVAHLTNVLATWTGISATHLQPQRLKPIDFIRGMQQRLFGQETAIASISHALQQAHVPLQEKFGAFCSMLFVGPTHVGKKSAGVAIAELLFKQPQAFYYVNFSPALETETFTQVKVRSSKDKRYHLLSQVIKETPYAVIYLDQVHCASISILHSLEEIFSSGFLIDDAGNHIDFRQSMIILGTTVGSERILNTVQPQMDPQDVPVGDLVQLILSDHEPGPGAHVRSFSPQALCEDILPILSTKFPPSLLHYLSIVPFVPLDYVAIERIIRLKLKMLANRLDAQYGIEFTYAPEVIRYLIQERVGEEGRNRSVDKIVEQRVYGLVVQVLLAQYEDKNRSNQLFLQLNDTGQLLKCDWLAAAKVG